MNNKATLEPSIEVLVHAAGIADAFRLMQLADNDGDSRFGDICRTCGGIVGIMHEIAEAAYVMERFREFLCMSVGWGDGLPHPYDVWDAIAQGLWYELGGTPPREIALRSLLRLDRKSVV